MTPKHPPHSMEAEQSVLGAMLMDPLAIIDCGDMLDMSDFYNADHRIIFDSILKCAKEVEADRLDFVTFSEWLRNAGLLEAAGGIQYIGMLEADTPSSANAKAYAQIVRERAQLRALIAAANRMADSAYNPDGRNPEELLQEAEALLNQSRVAGRRGHEADEGYDTLIPQVEEELSKAHGGGEKIHGLYTGFTELDELTTGLSPGDLIVIGARPSMGKTSLALNIAEYQAMYEEAAVGIFSMEMTKKQLVQRSIASIGRIDTKKIRTGSMDDVDWSNYVSASGILRKLPIRIDATRDLSMSEVRTRARRMKQRHNIQLLVVDYMQLMATPGKDRRDTELGNVSKGLKNLAGELGIPVIALSQLNRGLESRDNKRPRMSDLRESGGIEQDADLIVFIYRDEVYNRDSPDTGTAEIIVGKNRNGPVGMVRTAFLNIYSKFDNLAPDWHRPQSGSAPKKKRGGFSAEELNGSNKT